MTNSMNDQRVLKAREMRASGDYTYKQVADFFNVSTQTIVRWVNPAYNEESRRKSREYKRTVTGICEICGGPTRYAGGSTKGRKRGGRVSKRCASCAPIGKKYWTRERVIDAIIRYANENGGPPRAEDWIRADPKKGYPARTSVYRAERRKQSSAPFATWREGIEAAGFQVYRKMNKIDVGAMLEFIDEGMGDREMAEKLGCSHAGIRLARKRLNV